MKNDLNLNAHILIVDDEEMLLDVIREEVSDHFASVSTANGGEKALQILATTAIDLVVTDFRMPRMNGLELIARIKAKWPTMPVLMLTGNGNDPEILKALEMGAFDILDKPFRAQVLVNRIQNGLMLPLLLNMVWTEFAKHFSEETLDHFLQLPLAEQLRRLFAFSQVYQLSQMNKKVG